VDRWKGENNCDCCRSQCLFVIQIRHGAFSLSVSGVRNGQEVSNLHENRILVCVRAPRELHTKKENLAQIAMLAQRSTTTRNVPPMTAHITTHAPSPRDAQKMTPPPRLHPSLLRLPLLLLPPSTSSCAASSCGATRCRLHLPPPRTYCLTPIIRPSSRVGDARKPSTSISFRFCQRQDAIVQQGSSETLKVKAPYSNLNDQITDN
jgi:hypothetical protein